MQTRRFGRTGLDVPVLTFGGGWVGGVLIHGTEHEANEALEMAWSAGMDWIDTAAQYGNGVSETVIGRWLAPRPADERPRLSTKFRLDSLDGGAKALRDQMHRSVEGSLRRLGLDRVEVIILHNQLAARTGAGKLSAADALRVADEMERLREEGLCDHLGMTALGAPGALHDVLDRGRYDVAQVYYNMLNPTAAAGRQPWNSTDFAGLLEVCATRDVGVMGIRIFAAGHLATRERHGREIPVTDAAQDAAEERRAAAIWRVLSKDAGTPAQAAIRFGLACERLSTIVVGLGAVAHLREAIEAAHMGPLPEDQLDAIAAAWDDPAFTAPLGD